MLNPTISISPRARLVLLSLALVLLVGASYGRIGRNGFIDYDDPSYVTANRNVQAGLTLETASWAFRTAHHSNWHPLTWLSHALDCQVFGLAPAGHHFVSVALHAVNAVLLLLALHLMTFATWRSAAVAALFALHPLHVESVAWAAERKDVLSTLFWMLTLLAYARHVARPTSRTRVLVPLFFGLGLISKPMLVTLPFVLLLLDAWPLGRWGGTGARGRARWIPPAWLVREKLPLFVLSAASSVVTFVVQQRGGAVTALDVLPIGERFANAAVAYVAYLWKAIWPVALGVLYPLSGSLPAPEVLGACAVLVAITAAVLALRRRAPYLSTGWFWYVGTLVPVIGFVQVGTQSFADRYTYVPLIGVFVVLAWGLPDLLGAGRRARAVLASAAVLAVLAASILTWRQVGFWRDSETLFEHTLSITGDNYVTQNNLGGVLARQGRLDEAITHLQESRRIRPNHAPTLSNLGVAMMGKGRVGEAIGLFREALKVRPTHVEAWLNLGNALGKTGDIDGAIAAFREVERLEPGDPAIGALIRAAQDAKKRQGEKPGAPARVTPEARASFERGNGLRDEGRLEEAAAQYRDAIRREPEFAEAHNNLGLVLGRRGRAAEAIEEISKALDIAPDLRAAHNNLAIIYAMQGDIDRAARQFGEVLRLDPQDADAHFNLGLLLARGGKLSPAISHFEESLRIAPGSGAASRALQEARRRAAAGSGR
jgi:protein O-mannosyl-transferase